MKFGLQLPNYGAIAGPDAIASTARRAEELGFDAVFTNDHVLVPSGLTQYHHVFEAVTTLVWAAAHTRRVRLGTSIVVLPQRDPILAAKQLAMVDVLSGGRLIAGFGAGYVEEEFGFLRAPFRGRGATLDGHIAALRALWAGATEFEGPSASFSDARFGPLPPQGDRIPIWLGGHATVTLRRAAKLADAWNPGYMAVSTLAEKVAELRELAEGRTVEVALKLRISSTGEPFDNGKTPNVSGSPAEIREGLRRYEEAGADQIIVVFAFDDLPTLEREMDSFATDVMPHWRG